MIKVTSLQNVIPSATSRALKEADLIVDDRLSLNMKILYAGVEIHEAALTNESSKHMEFLIVGRDSVQATRTSFLSINLFSIVAGIIALARAPNDPASYVAFLVSLVATFTSKLNQEHAAFFVASHALQQECRESTLDNFCGKIGALIHRPGYGKSEAEKLMASLRAYGIEICVGPAPKELVSFEEKAIFLPI